LLDRLYYRHDVLLHHTWITGCEIILGLALGLLMGLFFALLMLLFAPVKRWLLPILIASQAIPVFAIAVTTCCFDGLRHTPQGYLDLAKTMGATPWQLVTSQCSDDDR